MRDSLHFYRLLEKIAYRNENIMSKSTGTMWEGAGNRFEVGDFVFAKLKGHPHWPATISQIETLYANSAPNHERTRYNVYFYGSHQMSMIKVDSIVSFVENYELFKKKYAANSKFASALEELEADKAIREEYVKSLQIVDSIRQNESQEKPDDEMFSSSSESTDDAITPSDRHSYGSANSSGFGESFDSDEEYQTLLNQRYEVLSMEKVPYLVSGGQKGTSDTLLIISLGFNDRDLEKDYQDIREELRMMTCFVKIERLVYPPNNVRAKRSPSKTTVYTEVEAVRPQELFPRKKRKKNKWKTGNKFNGKTSLTVLAAEAVKRRRRRRKTFLRDETRHLSLRQRHPDAAPPDSVAEVSKCSTCFSEKCTCVEPQQPEINICPICQAQFSSSIDFKQHSFNIHIMGL